MAMPSSPPSSSGYDCNDGQVEQIPNSLNFSPHTATLQNMCRDVVKELSGHIQFPSQPNEQHTRLMMQIGNLLTSQASAAQEYAIIGDMGSGKSNLINSLLGSGTIARSGASGESCTWVTHKYRSRFDEQKQKHAAKVVFFDSTQRRGVMQAVLESYCNAQHTLNELGREGDSMVMRELEKEKRDAVNLLRSLFRDHAEFNSDNAARDWLQDQQTTTTTKLALLHQWANTLVAKHEVELSKTLLQSDNRRDLMQTLQPYSHQSARRASNRTPDLWPLVKHIEFAVASMLLDRNVVLVDTAGLSDNNRFRRKFAEQTIKDTAHVIVVGNIKRALSDGALHHHLELAMRTRRPATHAILVLTHSEVIGEDDILDGTDEQMKDLIDCEDKQDQLGEKIKDLEEEVDVLAGFNARSEKLLHLQAEIDDLKTQAHDAEVSRLDILRRMRNDDVATKIKVEFEDVVNDAKDFPVFAVANQAYGAHQHGYTVFEDVKMSVTDTGIPKLRAYLLALPSKALMPALDRLVSIELPALLRAAELYARSTGTVAAASVVKNSVVDIDVQALVTITITKLDVSVRRHITNPMRQAQNDWQTKTAALIAGWPVDHLRQEFLDIIRRGGYRKWRYRRDRSKPLVVNWARDINAFSKARVQSGFDALLADIGRICNDLQTSISDTARTSMGQLVTAGWEGVVQTLIDSLLSNVHDKIQTLFENVLSTNVRSLGTRAAVCSEDAFINEHIVSTCERAATHTGSSKAVEARHEVLVTGGSVTIWPEMLQRINAEYEEILGKFKSALIANLTETIVSINDQADLLLARQTSSVREVQEPWAVALLEFIAKCNELLFTTIKPQLDVCREVHDRHQASIAA